MSKQAGREAKEKILNSLDGIKEFEVCFDDDTTQIIELGDGIDVDSYLHSLAKEQNKIIDEVFEIK